MRKGIAMLLTFLMIITMLPVTQVMAENVSNMTYNIQQEPMDPGTISIQTSKQLGNGGLCTNRLGSHR